MKRFIPALLFFLFSCMPSKEVRKEQDDPEKEEKYDNAVIIRTDKNPARFLSRNGWTIEQDQYGVVVTKWKDPEGLHDQKIRAVKDSGKVIMSSKIRVQGTVIEAQHRNASSYITRSYNHMKELAKEMGEIVGYTVR